MYLSLVFIWESHTLCLAKNKTNKKTKTKNNNKKTVPGQEIAQLENYIGKGGIKKMNLEMSSY